jgi:hypothetical protein
VLCGACGVRLRYGGDHDAVFGLCHSCYDGPEWTAFFVNSSDFGTDDVLWSTLESKCKGKKLRNPLLGPDHPHHKAIRAQHFSPIIDQGHAIQCSCCLTPVENTNNYPVGVAVCKCCSRDGGFHGLYHSHLYMCPIVRAVIKPELLEAGMSSASSESGACTCGGPSGHVQKGIHCRL